MIGANRPAAWRRRRYQVAAAAAVVAVVAALLAGRGPAHDSGQPAANRATIPGAIATSRPGPPERGASAAGAPGTAPATGRAEAAPPGSGQPDVTVTDSGSMAADHHTLRVVTAYRDLSRQNELAWAADAGQVVGDARCTQNFRFNPGSAARVRPTMLLCWRTSRSRSAYVLAVDVDRRPSMPEAVATLDRAWADLG